MHGFRRGLAALAVFLTARAAVAADGLTLYMVSGSPQALTTTAPNPGTDTITSAQVNVGAELAFGSFDSPGASMPGQINRGAGTALLHVSSSTSNNSACVASVATPTPPTPAYPVAA